MILKPFIEIVDIAGEYLAIPVGEESTDFGGIVVLNDATAFLLKKMETSKTVDELVDILVQEYDVDRSIADEDVKNIMKSLINMGLIDEK